MPSEPASTAASSLRMSPNRLPASMTSKRAGGVTRCIAQESTSVLERHVGVTRGRPARRRPPQARRSSTLALSIEVTLRRRPAPRRRRRAPRAPLLSRVNHRVERDADRHFLVAARPPRRAAQKFADHQHVGAPHDLVLNGEGSVSAVGRRRRRLAKPSRALRSASRTGLGPLLPRRLLEGGQPDRTKQYRVGGQARLQRAPAEAVAPNCSIASPPIGVRARTRTAWSRRLGHAREQPRRLVR